MVPETSLFFCCDNTQLLLLNSHISIAICEVKYEGRGDSLIFCLEEKRGVGVLHLQRTSQECLVPFFS